MGEYDVEGREEGKKGRREEGRTLLAITLDVVFVDVRDVVGFWEFGVVAGGVEEEVLEEFVAVLLFYHETGLSERVIEGQ